ncbi:hypothetical protein VB713_23630 [Anabaena cylindrica UHCC 0172]|uniref:hypothetical protein n=1 Tax=Anabaena cylindrica TaxID=1165 RepID=UPI002B20D7C4|nr:hypothetical protein [Anabaena cylindrica]MEA5553936.1 hypothetical protein [Anabaena cylindrica UHCC 0172]
MKISNIRLRPQQLLLSLSVVCGILGIINTDTVSSQTTSVDRILKVKPNLSTTFKRRENWYQQSKDITSNEEKCSVRQGTKFFVSTIRRQIQNAPARPQGNTEKLSDYWEVTFEQPLPCQQDTDNNPTWFVYKQHVQELRTILVP